MIDKQTIYADQEPGLSDGGTTAIIANFASQIIPRLFSGGKQDAKRRDQQRQSLSQVGFNWIPTSGVPAGQEWNIDNWPDVSLINIANATAKYGQIVPQLHNQKKFNPENTQTMQQIDSIVRANGGSPINASTSWGGQGFFSQSGSNNSGSSSGNSVFGQLGTWPMLLLGVGALGLVVSMRNSTPVKGSQKGK